ncbi:hypothetical protein ACFB49_27190 [Sphingomonas sp. DBB INV C78]|uniref:hypothetical protein n=1 Tax=Sphingomonas sp. DBB INV C78 TaxID=3349434 RepID=UPI0036D4256F
MTDTSTAHEPADEAPGQPVEKPAANAIGPAGVIANTDVGDIVSGQPAGGPHDLGRKAHEDNATD